MLFRPSFCANCGEKIERADWGLLTSRRFCELCETEYKGADYLPRAVVGIAAIAFIFGVGSYLKSGSTSSESQLTRQAKKIVETPSSETRPTAKETPPPVASGTSAALALRAPAPTPDLTKQTVQSVQVPTLAADDAYICGAETKKGTPCSRRVKGNVRCFQHLGMRAMLPPDKLKIRQP